MIVFSATNEVTGDVFVGSSRESLEVEWAQLISQADEGASGGFFNQLRNHGPEKFEVEAYAYAESGSELRELTREAREELSAEAIKSSRRVRSSSGASNNTMSMEAIMASIEEAAKDAEAGTLRSSEPSAGSKEPSAGPKEPSAGPKEQTVSSAASRPTIGLSKTPTSVKPEPELKIASGRSGSTVKEKRIREAIAAEREERDHLRQTGSRESQAEMNAVIARIEQRRLQNKASPKKTATKKAATKKSPAAGDSQPKAGSTAKSAVKPAANSNRLATGRTGSSAKEKRNKDAIAQEKAEREAQQQAKVSAEADEMAAILARLDSRSKDVAKIKRRR